MPLSTVNTLVPTQLGLPLSPDPAAAADGRVGLQDDAVLLARLEDVLVAAVRVELDLVQDGLHIASENGLQVYTVGRICLTRGSSQSNIGLLLRML